MYNKLQASLKLIRPANILTAFADILAGFAAAGGVILVTTEHITVSHEGLFWLLLSTFGLYGGGVVFNDVFDAELDRIERPDRVIPSGQLTKRAGSILGAILFGTGIVSAFQVNNAAGLLAIAITVSALVYDAKAKHSAFLGPLFMGLCRAGNLMLGVSVLPEMLSHTWILAFLPILYIGSITLISQGEVHGGKKTYGILAVGCILVVTGGLFALYFFPGYQLIQALPFIILFGIAVIPPFIRAAGKPRSEFIRTAVKRGVLSLIILNSAISAGFAGLGTGILVLLLLPCSILLANVFDVT